MGDEVKYNIMQAQTFGEQFTMDPAAKVPEVLTIQKHADADAKVTGGFGSKETTVLPTIKTYHTSPPLMKTRDAHGQTDKLAQLHSNTVSKKSGGPEGAALGIASKKVSKQNRLDQAGGLHFKGAFDDGVPEGVGPNDQNQMNVYETLKATDKNYDKMLNVATDILRTQQNNPNSSRQHIINAQAKFYGGDLARTEKAKSQRMKPAAQGHEAAPRFGAEDLGDGHNDREKRKYEAMAANMYQQHLHINNILNRYNASGMTLN